MICRSCLTSANVLLDVSVTHRVSSWGVTTGISCELAEAGEGREDAGCSELGWGGLWVLDEAKRGGAEEDEEIFHRKGVKVGKGRKAGTMGSFLVLLCALLFFSVPLWLEEMCGGLGASDGGGFVAVFFTTEAQREDEVTEERGWIVEECLKVSKSKVEGRFRIAVLGLLTFRLSTFRQR